MSRYSKHIEDTNQTVCYGFDNVTGYFLQVFNDEPDKDGEDVLAVDECSLFTNMSNGRMIELMVDYKLPEHHIERVAMDLPIN